LVEIRGTWQLTNRFKTDANTPLSSDVSVMKVATFAFLVCAWCSGSSLAADGGWRSPDGTLVPDTEARKSINGFGAWLVVTSDKYWQEKWKTPPHVRPHFTEAKDVKRGGRLTILIFFVNPKPDARHLVNIRCDIKVVRPDQSVSVNAKDISCMEGELKGSPHYIRLAAPVINFVGEPKDPLGEWRVEVSVTDAFRGTSIPVRASFNLRN
jgi:hypothetical protein